MNKDRTNALVASAYNLAAAELDVLREAYPNGMRPVDAANLSANARLAWITTYEQRLLKSTPAQQRRFLFTLAETREALNEARAIVEVERNPARMFLHVQIKGRDEAIRFIAALVAAGLDFHFDDSPETIINGRTGQPLFMPSEYNVVRTRIAELFKFLRDPFVTLLDELRRTGR